jgi:hypothetical protein
VRAHGHRPVQFARQGRPEIPGLVLLEGDTVDFAEALAQEGAGPLPLGGPADTTGALGAAGEPIELPKVSITRRGSTFISPRPRGGSPASGSGRPRRRG